LEATSGSWTRRTCKILHLISYGLLLRKLPQERKSQFSRSTRALILFPSDILCPRCKCSACYPLHRKGVDWPIFFLGYGLRPARCLTCARKFYVRYTIEPARPPSRTIGDELPPLRASTSKNSWDRAA
jgi:hypothetical protein